jgi:hypothetical protein
MSPRARGLRSVSSPPEGPRSRRVHAAEPSCTRPPPRARAAPARGETGGWRVARPCSRWLEGEACTTLNVVNARVRKVVDEFLELSEEERELAVSEIEAALDDGDEWDMDVSKEEILRRVEDVRSGRVQLLDADEVLAELRAKYARR